MSESDILMCLLGQMRAGAPKKPPTRLIRMRVSAQLHAYLGWLSRNTLLGASENEVATYL
jgi:hypothetical protein